MRIRTFILSASAVVACGFFGVSYFSLNHIVEQAVRENAGISSEALVRSAYTGMYQLMATGWSRPQVKAYLDAEREAIATAGAMVAFYRGPVVEVQFGSIQQPVLDARLREVFAQGQELRETRSDGVRYLLPLLADARCLRCHTAAKAGDVLGIIEVKQDYSPLLVRANHTFLLWLLTLAPLAMLGAGFVVWRVNRRLEQSIALVDATVAQIGKVSDLSHVEFSGRDLGFDELNRLFGHLGELVSKLRAVAVDKDVLRFEIGLLEKFVITSDVVRDWGEYIARLLVEINTVMPIHVLFSVFQVGDEVFDLEVFWNRKPTAETREIMEHHIRALVAADARISALSQVSLRHHEPTAPGEEMLLDQRSVVLETKTLILDQPRIGGIVGIGVHATTAQNDTLRLVLDSVLSTILNVVGSVKAIHKYTQDMEYYATRDPLTDLYNRRVFWELFEYEVIRASRAGYSFGLLVLDLDNFKLINDGHGHAVGDRYLQTFADTVKQALRPGDIFARYGGDEFVALLPNVMPEMAAMVAQRILAAVAEMRLDVDGHGIFGSTSIGLAVFPLHAGNAKDLFLFADTMMYKAKESGKNRVGIPDDEEVAAVFRDMTQTTMQVVEAVQEGRIEPFFQPVMDLQSGRIVGHEVLSRLVVNGQFLEAARFIEYAEKAGVIHKVDILSMEKALHAAAVREYGGILFLNLSPRALSLANFIGELKRMVSECGLQPGKVVFEITERDTLKYLSTLEQLAAELKLAGFGLAINDFGSGFSSFHYLRRLPLDYLKISGDFVANLLNNEKDRLFVQTIRQLASSLNIQVVAERVESQEILEALRELGVGFGQGYHIGRPDKNFAEVSGGLVQVVAQPHEA